MGQVGHRSVLHVPFADNMGHGVVHLHCTCSRSLLLHGIRAARALMMMLGFGGCYW